jgi:hypothetical protein
MTEDTGSAGSRSSTPTEAEVESLRVQLAALEEENASLRGGGSSKARAWIAGILIVIAALLVPLTVTAVWVNTTIMDTDVFVETVGPLAEEPRIQEAIAESVSSIVIDALDVEQRLSEALPAEIGFLAGPIAGATEEFVTTQADAIVKSEAFQTAWRESIRLVHETLISAVSGTGPLQASDGQLALDVNQLVTQVADSLEISGLAQLKGLLPEDSEIVLLESDALYFATTSLRTLNVLALVLPIVVLALFIGGIVAAPDRRRAAWWTGMAFALAMIVLILGFWGTRESILTAAASAGVASDIVEAVFDVIFASLLTTARAGVALGVIVTLGAVLAGPSKPAVAIRSGFKGGAGSMAGDQGFGAFGAWVAAHRGALDGVGVGVGLVVLIALTRPTTWAIVGIAAGVLVWVAAVEFVTAAHTASLRSELVADEAELLESEALEEEAETAEGILEEAEEDDT